MQKETLYQTLYSLMKNYVYRYSEDEFTLASGKKSHHYFNCKEILLYPDRLNQLAEYLVKFHIPSIVQTVPEAVGGLTMGADPLSYAISLEYIKNASIVYPLVVRKESKDHGTKKQIEGAISKVKSCLVLDDVITTGGSTIKAIIALREAGIHVTQGICILDRQEGGKEALMQEGVTMYPVFTKQDFI
jgi:orotate phosphoribosyltransferase